jgi:hypothetical protein
MPLLQRGCMAARLLEYVGYVHIYLGPYRGNPIAIYLIRSEKECRIGPKAYPWNDVIGVGETPNKAAADFEEKWKGKGLSADMYSGPSWEGGIKPEKPKPAAPPKPTPPAGTPAQAASATSPTEKAASPAPAKSPDQPASAPRTPAGTKKESPATPPVSSKPVAPSVPQGEPKP